CRTRRSSDLPRDGGAGGDGGRRPRGAAAAQVRVAGRMTGGAGRDGGRRRGRRPEATDRRGETPADGGPWSRDRRRADRVITDARGTPRRAAGRTGFGDRVRYRLRSGPCPTKRPCPRSRP